MSRNETVDKAAAHRAIVALGELVQRDDPKESLRPLLEEYPFITTEAFGGLINTLLIEAMEEEDEDTERVLTRITHRLREVWASASKPKKKAAGGGDKTKAREALAGLMEIISDSTPDGVAEDFARLVKKYPFIREERFIDSLRKALELAVKRGDEETAEQVALALELISSGTLQAEDEGKPSLEPEQALYIGRRIVDSTDAPAGAIEDAIALLTTAVEGLRTRGTIADRVQALMSLAKAYRFRASGDRKGSIETAIKLLAEAKKLVLEDLELLATIGNDLGMAHVQILQGAVTPDLRVYRRHGEEAERAFRQVLDLSKGTEPFARKARAQALVGLGLTLGNSRVLQLALVLKHLDVQSYQDFLAKVRESREPETLTRQEEAIDHLTEAVRLLTGTELQEEWADALGYLGRLKGQRLGGDRRRNLEEATGHLQQAVTFFRGRDSRYNTAVTLVDQARVTWMLSREFGSPQKDRLLEETESAFREASRLFVEQQNSRFVAVVEENLGSFLEEQGRREEAIESFATARAHCHLMRDRVPGSQRAELLERPCIESKLLNLVTLGRVEEAIEIAEGVKSLTALEFSKVAEKQAEKRYPGRGKTPKETFSTEEIKTLWRQATDDAEGLDGYGMQRVAGKLDALLLLLRVTREGTLAFSVLPNGEIGVTKVSGFTKERLGQLLQEADPKRDEELMQGVREVFRVDLRSQEIEERLLDLDARAGWYGRYQAYLQADQSKGARTEKEWAETQERVLLVLNEELLQPILGPLRDQVIKTQKGKKRPRLVIVPSGGLAAIPLHACYAEETEGGSRRYVLDDWRVSYAPSLTLLRDRLMPAVTPWDGYAFMPPRDWIGIANPASDAAPLPLSEWECESIAKRIQDAPLYNPSKVLKRFDAKAEDVGPLLRSRAPRLVHFACHGVHDFASPGSSHLLLDEKIDVGRLMDWLTIPGLAIVVFSACETGLGVIATAPEDQMGIAVGTLSAGARSVVGSLWSVFAPTTSLLMVRLWNGLIEGKGVQDALEDSMVWLRDLPAEEARAKLKELLGGLSSERQKEALEEMLSEKLKEPYPFRHPMYWAGFCLYGNPESKAARE